MKFIAVALAALTLPVFAASVKVTSFNYIRVSNDFSGPLAELCGLVEGAVASPTFVNISVDPNSKNPAQYNTFAGADGKFCMAVITYRGNANVSIVGEKAVIKALIR